ncbi:Sialidase domain-containing protein [Mycena venus]|uniref:Sialidase domain-containing protein n=1 Tax=Mycena venus TaxID=2733690 RepID=A0A8H6YEC3_9AGAR|nr:Sialidase domain-containing protein [Mycena venus]
MKFLFLLSALTVAFASPVVLNATLNARANGLAPTVDGTTYLVDGGTGTYPRLAHLADGSVLGTVTTGSSTKTLVVTRSTDGARTFSAWGTIATSTGDLDNAFLQQLANGDIIATFRNHDKNGNTYTIYRITACISHDNGKTWTFLSQVDTRTATATNNGLWEPWLRIAKSGALQVYYSAENNANDQDILLRTSTNNGATWSAATTVAGATTTGRDGMPSCADFTTSAGAARLICIFETTEGTAPRFNVKSVVSTNDGASFSERARVYKPTGTVTNAGAPFIVQTTGGTLVASFHTDEDTSAQTWPNGASLKILTSLSTDPPVWGQKTLVLPVQSLWGSLFKRVDGTSTVVAAFPLSPMQQRDTILVQGDPSLLRGEEVVRDAESFNAIVDDKLYLGNLSTAESPQLLRRLEITHVLSVCPDFLEISEPVKHFTLIMVDDEHFDILQHLPATCQFIQEALGSGGRSIVLWGYLEVQLWFALTHVTAAQAIRLVRKQRPKSRPNYNFIRQLQVFSECNCNVGPTSPPYIAWKERQNFDKDNSLRVIDGMSVLPDQLFLSFDFPSNTDHASALLEYLGVTHIVSITPDQISTAQNILKKYSHKHFIIPYTSKESLLLSLPLLCQFVDGALQTKNSHVFLHCMDELRGGIAVCAYRASSNIQLIAVVNAYLLVVMFSRHIQPSQAVEILQEAVPLFEDKPLVRRHLELFEQCQYSPSRSNPLVRAWLTGGPDPVVPQRPPSYMSGILETGKSLGATIVTLFGAVGT